MNDELEQMDDQELDNGQETEQDAQDWKPVSRRLPRKLPTARQLSLHIWLGVRCAVDLLDHPDPAVRLKAVHSLSAASGQFLKGLEVSDIQKRLAAIEEAMKKEGTS